MDEARIAILRAEVDSRQRDIDAIYDRIENRRGVFRETSEGIDSMAYQIHNHYSAFEQLFETVVHFFENRIEEERYHIDLLRRMRLEIHGIRPALVSDEAFDMLDELRRFRHFFRHAYTAELNPDNLADLVAKTDRLREVHRRDVEGFVQRMTQ